MSSPAMPDVSRLTVAASALSLVSAPLASRTGAFAVSADGAPGVAPGSASLAGRAWPCDHGGRALALRIRGGLGLRVDDRAGHFRRLLGRHQNVVLLVAIPRFRIGERLRPALSLAPAGAVRIEGFLELAGVGQIDIGLARRRLGLFDRSAEREGVEGHVRVGAQGPAHVFKAVRPASRAGIGNGEEAAVTGAHAYRIGAGARVDASVLARLRRLFAAARRDFRIRASGGGCSSRLTPEPR